MQNFFIGGDAKDTAYVNLRDLEKAEEYRVFVNQLWARYRGNEDKNFRTDAKNHFQQRFWEMYLWVALEENGFTPKKVSDAGPEFYIEINGIRYWVEAVCPTAGVSQDAVTDEPCNEFREIPVESILLRYTGSMRDKLKKRDMELSHHRISTADGYILAVNSGAISMSACLGGEIPYIVKACYPIGNLAIPIDRMTKETGKPHYTFRNQINKKNMASVTTGVLLEKNYSAFSAVIHSTSDCTRINSKIGSDFELIHNPHAITVVPEEKFSWTRRWSFKNESLLMIDRWCSHQ